MSEVIAKPTGSGFVCTDDSVYPTIAAALAAGKVLFPGTAQRGEYPSSLVLTSVAAAGGAGSYFEFRINTQDAPTVGVPVLAGQSFVEEGFSPTSRQLIGNLYIGSKAVAGDLIYCTAVYS